MKDIIRQYLLTLKNNKRLETKSLEQQVINTVGLEAYWDIWGGYEAFAQAILALGQEGLLRPVKAWKQNGMNPALYKGYQLVLPAAALDSEVMRILSTQYHPKLNVSYYFTHQEAYQQDKDYLTALNRFFKQNPAFHHLPAITVNERSFQIFYDEKWLISPYGHTVLQRLGVTLEDLRCYPTYEPFFYYQTQHQDGQAVNGLIVENKDTFFSLKMLLQQGVYTWGDTSFSLLIYGEGRKIEKSFSFFGELKEYKNRFVHFYYFGDLDPEGIDIWYALQKQNQVKIQPFVFFYQTLVQRYRQVAQPLKKNQRVSPEGLQAFLTYFSAPEAALIAEMLDCRLYLPQEGVHYQLLYELSN